MIANYDDYDGDNKNSNEKENSRGKKNKWREIKTKTDTIETKDNCMLPTDQCRICHTVWTLPLAIWGQLSQLSPKSLCTPSLLAGGMG